MTLADASNSFSSLGFTLFGVVLLALAGLIFSSYIKISVALSILRLGFGLNGLPSVFVTFGLALALSFFVMSPTIEATFKTLSTSSNQSAALESMSIAWKEFLKIHAQKETKEKLASIIKSDEPMEQKVDSWRVIAPAFLISELKSAFAIGLNLFLPLFVIDILVSLALAALGTNSLNPELAALPFKIGLFIAVDGWELITTNLVKTYLV